MLLILMMEELSKVVDRAAVRGYKRLFHSDRWTQYCGHVTVLLVDDILVYCNANRAQLAYL